MEFSPDMNQTTLYFALHIFYVVAKYTDKVFVYTWVEKFRYIFLRR